MSSDLSDVLLSEPRKRYVNVDLASSFAAGDAVRFQKLVTARTYNDLLEIAVAMEITAGLIRDMVKQWKP